MQTLEQKGFNIIDLETLREILQIEIAEQAKDYNFRLYLNEKNITEEESDVTKGLIAIRGSTIVPIQEIKNYNLNLDLMIIVKQDDIERYQTALFNTVTKLSGSIIGQNDFRDTTVIFNSDLPTLGTTEIRAKEGLTTPIFLSISLQCIKNGVLSNNFKLKLNNEDLHPLSFSFQRAKILEALNIVDEEEVLNISDAQTLVIQIQLLYTKNEIVKNIVNDILNGNNKKSYMLNINTPDLQFSKMVIIRDGVVSLEAGKIPVINASFVLADKEIYGD